MIYDNLRALHKIRKNGQNSETPISEKLKIKIKNDFFDHFASFSLSILAEHKNGDDSSPN